MWMAVFVWCLFSSAVIYSTAAVLAFAALRKHSLGRLLNSNTVMEGSPGVSKSRYFDISISIKYSNFSR